MTEARSYDSHLLHRARRIIALSTAAFALAGGAMAQTGGQDGGAKMPSNEPDSAATAVQGAFKRMDANKDGKLTKDEVKRNPTVSAKFDSWDQDKDGALSAEEFNAGYGAASR
jgi:hypothetical protein